jgi:hypothetical protein
MRQKKRDPKAARKNEKDSLWSKESMEIIIASVFWVKQDIRETALRKTPAISA